MNYKVMYNAALLMNEMILFGCAYMPVNVKLFSTKINLTVTRNTFQGWFPLQQIRMCQITMPQLQSR